MAYDKQKVIDIALSQVGYLEKASNKDLDSMTGNAGRNNYTKYARDLWAVKFFNGSKTGKAWCAVFVGWCFYKAFGKKDALYLLCQPSSGNCGAGCKYIYRYFKAKKQWHTTGPQPGDVIVFSSSSSDYAHTGLVYKVDSSRVYTVEGNTSGASGVISNGGGVCKKSYALTGKDIVGYGRPNWGTATQAAAPKPATPASTTTATKDTVQTYTVKNGDTLWAISKKHLGRGNRYKEIMLANGMKNTIIRAGMVLKIPNK